MHTAANSKMHRDVSVWNIYGTRKERIYRWSSIRKELFVVPILFTLHKTRRGDHGIFHQKVIGGCS